MDNFSSRGGKGISKRNRGYSIAPKSINLYEGVVNTDLWSSLICIAGSENMIFVPNPTRCYLQWKLVHNTHYHVSVHIMYMASWSLIFMLHIIFADVDIVHIMSSKTSLIYVFAFAYYHYYYFFRYYSIF